MTDRPLILFDGICNFCNGAVQFVLKRDRKKRILFAPMQSDAAKTLLKKYGLEVNEFSSFVFIENGKAYTRSTAALRVCRYLRLLWPLCYGAIIVPPFIRNGIYDWVARHRYKWFGVRTSCMIPTPEIRERFLDA